MEFFVSMPTQIYFGKDSIKNVDKFINNGDNVLLVYGGGSIKANGVYDQVIKQLDGANIIEHSGIKPNPTLESVYEGIKKCEENNIDLIIAVGGGSVIDAAKAIGIGAHNDTKDDIWDIMQGKCMNNSIGMIPVGAVLTLAATGSEANYNFVITNEQTNVKLGWRVPGVSEPTFAILDPSYTISVPYNQTVNGIVDTFMHLLEQYFHNMEDNAIVRVNEKRMESLMNEILRCGEKLLNDLDNYELRAEMMYIATQALNGELRSTVGGDWSCHLMSYPISGIYDVSHGEALAILVPRWLEYVKTKNPSRVKMLEENVCSIDELVEYFNKIKMNHDLGKYAKKEDIAGMVETILTGKESIGGYVALDKNAITEIFEKSFEEK